jgi:hypothetical protein
MKAYAVKKTVLVHDSLPHPVYTVQCIYIDTANRDGKESFNFGYRIDPISDKEISD